MNRYLNRYGLPLIIGIIALFFPLIRDLHVESAILASAIGAFYAGIRAARNASTPGNDRSTLLIIETQIYAAALPIAVMGLLTNCITVAGLGYWIFYPSFSILFGYCLGRCLRKLEIPMPVLWTVIILILIGAGEFLLEFYFLPQVYFYNQVWGGWPGPIYDEAVPFTAAIIYFRLLTVFWCVLLWFLPEFWSDRMARILFFIAVAGLVVGYSLAPGFHVITPRRYIQQVLGGKVETPDLVVYYDKRRYKPWEIKKYVTEAEFDIHEISNKLQISPPTGSQRIQCYFYADAWQKKELVGAKFTSYVPVWNPVNQVHIAKSQIDQVLRHELTHVLAKQFGNRILHASWDIGLVEGLAVAMAPDESNRATLNQMVAASKPWPDAADIRNALSLTGFYHGRPGVNYVTMGSFVQYLLGYYPVSDFKKAYKNSDLENAYPVALDSLVKGWHQVLERTPVDSIARHAGKEIFAIPSLFEEACPHKVSPAYQYYDRFQHAMAREDTVHAITVLRQSLSRFRHKEAFWLAWSYLEMKTGKADSVVDHPVPVPDSVSALYRVRMADAMLMVGDSIKAQTELDSAKAANKGSFRSDQLAKRIYFRASLKRWRGYLKAEFGREPLRFTEYESMATDNQLLYLERMMNQHNVGDVIQMAPTLMNSPVDEDRLGIYLRVIKFLAMNRENAIAEKILQKMDETLLRLRSMERVAQTERLVRFIEKNSY